ncbi:uncharacterized protein LOC116179617 isoform X1 [Photinus pyralis]|uniref:Uncharacterized protein n=2 Tax=Photinus pyralis TaxID=7054 RepID=A0A1Y1LKF6_PHOPY|nr:uncharacterized protein LOC116179617 isoform X1 [Photinus pyralis]
MLKMAKRLTKNHYVAPRLAESPTPVHINRNPAYSDEEGSQRGGSEHGYPEYASVPYTVVSDRNGRRHQSPHSPSVLSKGSGYGDTGSDIYVTSGAYKSPSEISRGSRAPRAPSQFSYRSGKAPSLASTAKTRTSRKAGARIEAMTAPNPFCPNIKGMCCLMILLNLGIILVTLGFIIVIQFFEPVYVWILGIVFLVFGFITLIISLLYCVVIFRDARNPKDVNPEDLYWTHHWQKDIGSPEVHYKSEEKYNDDRYSDRYSVSKLSGKYSDRNGRY